jgi:hypothetical protein
MSMTPESIVRLTWIVWIVSWFAAAGVERSNRQAGRR